MPPTVVTPIRKTLLAIFSIIILNHFRGNKIRLKDDSIIHLKKGVPKTAKFYSTSWSFSPPNHEVGALPMVAGLPHEIGGYAVADASRLHGGRRDEHTLWQQYRGHQ